MTARHNSLEDIAIIGMSGRFPGARDLTQFWDNLKNGVESISFFSDEEVANAGTNPAVAKHPGFVNAGGVLEDIDLFDASFFGISPREAETLDPQQRLLLETAWQALEDAGYDSNTYKGSIGIYAGGLLSSYLFNILSNREHRELVGDFQAFTGNDKDHLTTRVAYKLNLKGPSITVQTACSTSLVAVAMACQSLVSYQCDMVLAGGVAVRVPEKAGYLHQEGMIFSRDGHSRPFDAEASGTVFGNGVGVVVLKRLSDAIADRDFIHAVIKGSAVNNDGSLKVGYIAPSLDAQAEVIALAQAIAEVDPKTITYVEAHGSSTPLGDSIEMAALTKAFGAEKNTDTACAIGSLKSNVGSLDAAAGVAGLIKTVLALKNRMIPPSINFSQPNPLIDFASSPFYLNTRLSEWKGGSTPRRAGVSSFGLGGTNAHLVVEEAPAFESTPSRRSRHLVLLSARSRPALEKATAALSVHLREHDDLNPADVACTSQLGRRAFTHRRAVVYGEISEGAKELGLVDGRNTLTGTKSVADRAISFMFPDEEVARVNMGLGLYRTEQTFQDSVDECAALLKAWLGLDLRDALYPPSQEEADRRFEQAEIAQPALFVVEYALARLWMEWGVRPQTMIGHGVGEYVAACLAGVFSLEDALSLVAQRARLGQRPADFTALVSRVSLRAPQIPYLSSVTGTWITAESATDSAYWATHLHRTECFSQGLSCLLSASNRVLLEVGPGGTLAALAQQQTAKAAGHLVHSSLGQMEHGTSDADCMMNTLGQLWVQGTEIDWQGFWRHESRYRVPLPTYPFERKRYWVEAQGQPEIPGHGARPLAEFQTACWSTTLPASSVDQAAVPPVADHERPAATPSDDIERTIAEMWQKILGIQRPGVYDNFFELGGDSLLGTRLLSLLRSSFRVQLPLQSLLEVPTVAGMAQRVRALR